MMKKQDRVLRQLQKAEQFLEEMPTWVKILDQKRTERIEQEKGSLIVSAWKKGRYQRLLKNGVLSASSKKSVNALKQRQTSYIHTAKS